MTLALIEPSPRIRLQCMYLFIPGLEVSHTLLALVEFTLVFVDFFFSGIYPPEFLSKVLMFAAMAQHKFLIRQRIKTKVDYFRGDLWSGYAFKKEFNVDVYSAIKFRIKILQYRFFFLCVLILFGWSIASHTDVILNCVAVLLPKHTFVLWGTRVLHGFIFLLFARYGT